MEKKVIIPISEFRKLETLPKTIDGIIYNLECIWDNFEDKIYGKETTSEQEQSMKTIERAIEKLSDVLKTIDNVVK